MQNIVEKIREFHIVPYLIVFYSVGIAGLLIPQSHELFKSLIPLNLILNIGLLLIYHGKHGRGFIWKGLLIFVAGVLIEILGVNTGLIFGSYEYGPTLGLKVFHTPLIIGANWLMLVYTSLVITSKFFEQRYFRVFIAAVMMVVYDIVLEPAAIDLKMWSWGSAVPLQNYIAWLVISYIFIWFADWSGLVNKHNKLAAPLFFIQMVFFIILDLWMLIRVLWEF